MTEFSKKQIEDSEKLNEQMEEMADKINSDGCVGFVIVAVTHDGYESIYGGTEPTIWPLLTDATLKAASRIILEQGIEPFLSLNPNQSETQH